MKRARKTERGSKRERERERERERDADGKRTRERERICEMFVKFSQSVESE